MNETMTQLIILVWFLMSVVWLIAFGKKPKTEQKRVAVTIENNSKNNINDRWRVQDR